MSGLDSIPLDGSGLLDMDDFPDDGTVLADDALADLRQALLSDPVDEPTDDDWSALMDGALDDPDPADGPFTVDDDDPVAGVRQVDPDEAPTDDDGPDITDDTDDTDAPDDDGTGAGDPDPDPGDDDGTDPGDDDGTDAGDDDGTGLDPDLDGDLGAGDLIGLDLLDLDDDAIGAEALAPVEEPDAPAEVAPDFEDYL